MRAPGEAVLPRGLIGVIHLPALPGDPGYAGGGFVEVQRRALADAEALAEGGVDALIVENFGSAPFARGDARQRASAASAATLALLARRCIERFALPVGLNCLRNDALTALGAAAAAGADFIRVNIHTGAYVTDQGLIEGDAFETLRSRRALEAETIGIAADVLVKHATPLAPISMKEAARDCLGRGMADAVIVTGSATGAGVDRARLLEAREAAGDRPVWIGSGLTPENIERLAPLADAAIVGTWLKEEGALERPVSRARVEQMASALRGRLRGG
ncbi:MAG: BtpA/SgcQ family protein [Myxococcales bacterium]|nr:BtpA/SgcQ family protein [Myxococcales bacterium]